MQLNCNKEPTHARHIAHAWGFYFGIYFIYFLGVTLKGRAFRSKSSPFIRASAGAVGFPLQSLTRLRYVSSTDTCIKSWPCNFRSENIVLGHNFIHVSNVYDKMFKLCACIRNTY